MTALETICKRHVAWYRKYGRYPTLRIKRDARGIEYVMGDWSWQRMWREGVNVERIDYFMETHAAVHP